MEKTQKKRRHRFLFLQSYPGVVVFAFMGLCGTVGAFQSIDLVRLAAANASFIAEFGLLAITEGGLLQTLEILLRSTAVLLAYLGFKSAESELVGRWRRAAPDDDM